MKTFNEIVNANDITLNTKEREIKEILSGSNYSFMDDGREGNYLTEFLRLHGSETVKPIRFYKGCPVSRGTGIMILGPVRVYDHNNNFREEFKVLKEAKKAYNGSGYFWVETKRAGEKNALPWTYEHQNSLKAIKNVRQWGEFKTDPEVWVCEKCGRAVPISKTGCPRCSQQIIDEEGRGFVNVWGEAEGY